MVCICDKINIQESFLLSFCEKEEAEALVYVMADKFLEKAEMEF